MTTIVCPHCEAENRATAKFCRSCAKLMVDLTTGTLLTAKRKRRRRSTSSSSNKSIRWLRPATLGIAAGILLLGGAWWHFTQDARVSTAHQAEVGGSFQPHAGTETGADSDVSMPALVEFPSYISVDTPPPEAAKADAKAEAPQKPKPHTKPNANEAARQRHNPQAPEAVERMVKATPAPAPTAPPASTPAPRPTPEQACQNTSFLSQSVCMQTHCTQPGNREQPQCKRMFGMQETLRHGGDGG